MKESRQTRQKVSKSVKKPEIREKKVENASKIDHKSVKSRLKVPETGRKVDTLVVLVR